MWLPRNTTILFRFFTGKVVPPEAGKEHNCMEVILWETNIQPRQVLTTGPLLHLLAGVILPLCTIVCIYLHECIYVYDFHENNYMIVCG